LAFAVVVEVEGVAFRLPVMFNLNNCHIGTLLLFTGFMLHEIGTLKCHIGPLVGWSYMQERRRSKNIQPLQSLGRIFDVVMVNTPFCLFLVTCFHEQPVEIDQLYVGYSRSLCR